MSAYLGSKEMGDYLMRMYRELCRGCRDAPLYRKRIRPTDQAQETTYLYASDH